MTGRSQARTKPRPDNSRQRVSFVVLALAVWMLVVGGRLVQLQVFRHEQLAERARGQQQSAVKTNAPRGLILDRQGRELARSLEVDSFFAVPSEVEDARAAARKVAQAAGVDAAPVERALVKAKESGRSKFVWLARELEPEQAARVRALGLKGVQSVRESKRYYPNGPLAAHVLGFVGLDDAGLAGVERFQNASLNGDGGRIVLSRDARRRAFESAEDEPLAGKSVSLTIDQNVQYLAERAVASAVERTQAKSGTAVVLDPRTGEVLALVNAPTFDPNTAHAVAPDLLANKSLQYIYEPGSTFKVVAYSAAIEEKLVKPTDLIDCQGGSINIFGRTVHDSHPHGTLTITEALAQSSNVAAIKLGMRVGNERLYDYVRRFGFGQKTGVELPGETRGLLRDVKRWDKTSIGSIPMGQEIGVTPIQVASAFAAIANDGERVAPHVVREMRDAAGNVVYQSNPERHRVVSVETARTIRTMLESVTLDGTAKAAQLEGYSAAGKTGTAQKVDPQTHTYSKSKYVASFVGFAPVEKPSVVIIVVLDEPAGSYYGGTVAAPVFKEIAEQVLPYLGVAPDVELKPEAPRPQRAEEIARLNHAPSAQEWEAAAAPDSPRAERVAAPAMPEVVRGDRVGGEIREVVYAAAAERALLMPDLRGRSVRDVMRACAALGLELEARGEGRAAAQEPAPGARVRSGQQVKVEFARRD